MGFEKRKKQNKVSRKLSERMKKLASNRQNSAEIDTRGREASCETGYSHVFTFMRGLQQLSSGGKHKGSASHFKRLS